MKPLPLYVDLDGTLVATDTLWESLVLLVKKYPRLLWRLPLWLMRGRAGFKEALAYIVTPDPDTLPYRAEVLALIHARHQEGGEIILATAAHQKIASRIQEYLGCFDAVLSSHGQLNLSGVVKAQAIKTHANGSFAYIGDHQVDLPVWRVAKESLLVADNAENERFFAKSLGKAFDTSLILESENAWRIIRRSLRIHQWTKNILLFVPLILAHQFFYGHAWQQAIIGCVCFGLMASSIYLVNDLFDLAADRRHPTKRTRPLASGALSIPQGFVLAITCFTLALIGGWIGISFVFAAMLVGYALVTVVYSSTLKRIPVVDILALAFFYVYRLVAGAIATGVVLTPWLLAFAAFFFVSLGCLKRVGELTLWRSLPPSNQPVDTGRGYMTDYISMLALFGVNAGFLSLLVLALYMNSAEVVSLYRHPLLLWGVIIALLYWLMRSWLLTWRGKMHDDPVLFALQDTVSRWVGIAIVICLFFAL
jgi:4-hydroxybenzoate polyprenyltransferase